jgi:CBS domain-containing protein
VIGIALTVKDFMRELITIDGNEPVVEVAKTMHERKISSVVVLDNGKPFGIITERDIVIRVDAQCEELKEVKCKEIASSPLLTINFDAKIHDATRLMEEKNVKKLLVTSNGGQIVGIVSMTDLLKSVTAIFDVIDVMKKFI